MSLSILVVDDDSAFLALVARLVRDLGFDEVTTTSDAAAALREAGMKCPDAALVDIELLDADGIELAHQLAALPWSPRVVLTSIDEDAMSAVPARDRRRPLPFIPKNDLAESSRLSDLLLGGQRR